MFLSPKNIHRGPGSTILGSIVIIAALSHWFKTGQWTDGHSWVFLAGVGMVFSPDSLKAKAKE